MDRSVRSAVRAMAVIRWRRGRGDGSPSHDLFSILNYVMYIFLTNIYQKKKKNCVLKNKPHNPPMTQSFDHQRTYYNLYYNIIICAMLWCALVSRRENNRVRRAGFNDVFLFASNRTPSSVTIHNVYYNSRGVKRNVLK